MIEAAELSDFISYDRESGLLVCVKRFGRKFKPGDVINSLHNKGYIAFYFKGEYVLGHRVAWAIENGEWPDDEIDHRDGDRSNNKYENLRKATHAENMQNKAIQINNKSGIPGVWFERRTGRWRAEIQAGGRKISVGRFATKERAAAEMAVARVKFHPFQPIHRELAA